MSTSSAGLKLSASIDDWGGTLVGASVDQRPITGISPASEARVATTLQEMSARPDRRVHPTGVRRVHVAGPGGLGPDPQGDGVDARRADTRRRGADRLRPGASTSDGAEDLTPRARELAKRRAPLARVPLDPSAPALVFDSFLRSCKTRYGRCVTGTGGAPGGETRRVADSSAAGAGRFFRNSVPPSKLNRLGERSPNKKDS